MKRFRFRLERLLKLKERAERLKLLEHEESNRRVLTQERYLEALECERLRQSERQRTVMSGGVDVTALRSYSRYYHKLRTDRIAGDNLRVTLKKDERQKHEELVAATREKRALEKYREKERSRYYKALEKQALVEQDDLSAQRFIRESSFRNSTR